MYQAGEYYWRGEGPAYKVTAVREGGHECTLVATTTVTGAHTLSAQTEDIPYGWYGPLPLDEVARIEAAQRREAVVYRRRTGVAHA